MTAVEVRRSPAMHDPEFVRVIGQVVEHEGLCPDDIFERLRHDHPGLTLHRVLITLYENSAFFVRRRGRWQMRHAPIGGSSRVPQQQAAD
ncbi:MAG: hypothetical protein R2686_00735 [Candidatus Nanopelagicales bacterium]